MNIPVTQSENFAGRLEAVIGKDKVIFEKIEGAKHGGPEFLKYETGLTQKVKRILSLRAKRSNPIITTETVGIASSLRSSQ